MLWLKMTWKPILLSCIESRSIFIRAPVHDRVMRNPVECHERLDKMKQLFIRAGDFDDESSPDQTKIDVLTQFLIDNAKHTNFVDLDVPDTIVYLSMASVLRGLFFLLQESEFIELLNKIADISPVCRANVFGEPFVQRVKITSRDALVICIEDVPGFKLVDKFQRQFFVTMSYCDRVVHRLQKIYMKEMTHLNMRDSSVWCTDGDLFYEWYCHCKTCDEIFRTERRIQTERCESLDDNDEGLTINVFEKLPSDLFPC